MSGQERAEASWFETLGVRIVHEGYSTVRLETIALPDGHEATREVVVHDDAVAIVPVTDRGDVLLLRQYRQPLRRYLLEVPAGTLDAADESPADAAARELREETQHDARDLRHLTTFHNSAGWSTERTHVYVATGLSIASPPPEFVAEAEEADMEVVSLPFTAALEMARTGELTDAKTVIGILLAEPLVI